MSYYPQRPYHARRRQYRKPAYSAQKRWESGGAAAGKYAYKAYKLATKLAQVINVEFKQYDYAATGQNVDFNGTYTANVCIPAQGVADNQRSGDSIKLQRMDFEANVRAGSNATIPANCRVILVWDKENSITGVGDLIDPIYLGTQLGSIAPRDHDKKSKYVILKEWHFDLSRPDSSVGLKHLHCSMDLKNKHVQFEAGSTTIQTGGLKMLFISNVDPATATNIPVIDWVFRTYYTDN